MIFSEHILAMCVDENCHILFTCKFLRKFREKKISSYFLADTAGYVSLWYIGDYACKQPDSKEKQMKFAEEKTRILAKFSSHLRSTIAGIFYRKSKMMMCFDLLIK